MGCVINTHLADISLQSCKVKQGCVHTPALHTHIHAHMQMPWAGTGVQGRLCLHFSLLGCPNSHSDLAKVEPKDHSSSRPYNRGHPASQGIYSRYFNSSQASLSCERFSGGAY